MAYTGGSCHGPQTLEAQLVFVIGDRGGNVCSEEHRCDLTDHGASLLQPRAQLSNRRLDSVPQSSRPFRVLKTFREQSRATAVTWRYILSHNHSPLTLYLNHVATRTCRHSQSTTRETLLRSTVDGQSRSEDRQSLLECRRSPDDTNTPLSSPGRGEGQPLACVDLTPYWATTNVENCTPAPTSAARSFHPTI